MSNPIIIIGTSAFNLGLNAALTAIRAAIDFVLGQIMLNALGYGAIAVAAGTLSSAILPLVVGSLILMIPMRSVQSALKNAFKNAPFTLFLLELAANAAYLFASAAVGATIFGLAVNPLGLCMVAGGLLLQFSFIALSLLYKCAVELARSASQPPRDMCVYETSKSAHNRNGLFADSNSRRYGNCTTDYSPNLDLDMDDDFERYMKTM